MLQPHKEKGFTLIEVLVALLIIAVAMAAAARLSGVMTFNNGVLRDRAIALLEAQNQLAELRMMTRLRPGFTTRKCDQGWLSLTCEQTLKASAGGMLMRVSLRVLQRDNKAPPLARLDTIIAIRRQPKESP
ncbi:type II secretion system minor pseudopilin GspI [Pseudomonas ficuserectae]|uniref:type II secretion system minor pseudopilin GspI n=1 Tax=Pseudomonas ficuserectae TaxID=53410 RepID=UPI0006D5D1E8|nr:type II secretion system minor pseudopilin GspI [Pseudomonas ficuserectae]KPX32305.1 proteinral secretion pathway protein I [Pseudomonas ficuserectae]RMS34267.1 proteinral secretion pathway protein I [Pseudomonas ficuserectae]RMS40142.1 proteinral secretion pathway protein I [Pseudomonas ficuserectae]